MGKMRGALFLVMLLLVLSPCCFGYRPWPHNGLPARPPTKTVVCPRDSVKLGACAAVLGLAGVMIGAAPKAECCSLLGGLAAADVAACLCVVAKETVLGITTEWSVALSPVITACNAKIPSGFTCA